MIPNNKPVVLESALSQMRGLLFRPKGTCLIFDFKKEVHHPINTWWIFYPIDLVFLNKNKEVIETKERLQPFRIYQPTKKYYYLVEFPSSSSHSVNIFMDDLKRLVLRKEGKLGEMGITEEMP